MKAVVLFSGGIDSTVVLYEALSAGYDVTALSFNYGQRHVTELEHARSTAARLKIPHHIQPVSLSYVKSPLLDGDAHKEGNMYVPARNTLFLSFALALCESVGATNIFIGANADDFAGYPDCRPVYMKAFKDLANLAGLQRGYQIHAPLINLSKQEIVKRGHELGVDFDSTSSCYAPLSGQPCNVCDACVLRAKALQCTK